VGGEAVHIVRVAKAKKRRSKVQCVRARDLQDGVIGGTYHKRGLAALTSEIKPATCRLASMVH